MDRELPIYHDPTKPVALGCKVCPELGICGGLQTDKGLFSCLSFCECPNPALCRNLCPRNLENFVNGIHEIRGFDINNVRSAQVLRIPTLPYVVPHIYGCSRRAERLRVAAVSVPLGKLFNRKTGAIKYHSKGEVAEAFGFDESAKLLVDGVSEDQPIEDYWTHRRVARIPSSLATLNPSLITVPNYSLFTNIPRWDNLHSMKRIAICWAELTEAGIPASLHLNARTDKDWERWIDFIGRTNSVGSIAFEFATGAASMERALYHVERLIELAEAIERPMQLVLRGGQKHLRNLRAAFMQIVLIDTTSYVKTVKRKRLDWTPNEKKHWRSAHMSKAEPLDELFFHNVETFAKMQAFIRDTAQESTTPLRSSPVVSDEREPNPAQLILPWSDSQRKHSGTQWAKLSAGSAAMESRLLVRAAGN